MDFNDIVHSAADHWESCGEWLASRGYDWNVDEISILFHDPVTFKTFKEWTQAGGGRPEYYHEDAQVMYTVNDLGAKEYAYHVRFNFFHMPGGWRIQTQTQSLVNPVRPVVHPLFQGSQVGEVVHISFKVPVLATAVDHLQKGAPWVMYMESEHGYSAYLSKAPGTFPYLHPRMPKSKP